MFFFKPLSYYFYDIVSLTFLNLSRGLFFSFLPYFTGWLGSVWWRLWRVVPPGLCGCVMRDGREWGLHLHGLLPEGCRWRNDRRGGVGGERRCADNVNVRQRRAECAIVISDCLLVIGFSLKPSDITSATAGFSAGQLALIKNTLANDRDPYKMPSIQASFSTSRQVNSSCNCWECQAQEKRSHVSECWDL